jgi:hypothetical protein
LSFATPLERVDTLETTDLHVGAPVLYSMKPATTDGNLSSESRGLNSLPAMPNQQPEASFAWGVVMHFVKRRPRILKPCD